MFQDGNISGVVITTPENITNTMLSPDVSIHSETTIVEQRVMPNIFSSDRPGFSIIEQNCFHQSFVYSAWLTSRRAKNGPVRHKPTWFSLCVDCSHLTNDHSYSHNYPDTWTSNCSSQRLKAGIQSCQSWRNTLHLGGAKYMQHLRILIAYWLIAIWMACVLSYRMAILSAFFCTQQLHTTGMQFLHGCSKMSLMSKLEKNSDVEQPCPTPLLD